MGMKQQHKVQRSNNGDEDNLKFENATTMMEEIVTIKQQQNNITIRGGIVVE